MGVVIPACTVSNYLLFIVVSYVSKLLSTSSVYFISKTLEGGEGEGGGRGGRSKREGRRGDNV